MNRQEIEEKIEKLPVFEKRDVFVSDSANEHEENKTKQKQEAICEVGKSEAYAYVAKNYKLVQMKTVFKPILDSVPGELEAYMGHWKGYAFLKIFPELDALRDDRTQFGIMIVNSVDLSASIMVKFVVKHGDDLYFTIPAKVAGLKKQHSGNVENVVRDYISMVGKVKQAWYSIVDNFPKYKVCLDINQVGDDELALEFETIIKKLKLGKRLSDKIRKDYEESTYRGREYTLWDVFIKVVNEAANVNHKSDTHREKRLDTISNTIFEYAMALSI